VISRRIEAIARIVEKEPMNLLSIKLDSIENDFKATLILRLENESESTRVKFSANIEARGPFQMIVNQMIKGQLDKLIVEFAANLSKALS
jgi:carbon monoxide dehydrogenase subunit G